MNSFSIEISNKETALTSIVDVTLSGGAYSINIDNLFCGTMVRDNTSAFGFSTTDKMLLPYLEPIAKQLKSKRKQISISEIFAAVFGILQLITFLSGTIISFKLKSMMQKTRVFLLLNLLPVLLE